MCLAVISTSHPLYPFVLISNRDEFLDRPTLPADWWPAPHGHVLAGRDLRSPAQGTWLGITKQGRLAVLTNFREPQQTETSGRSRGEISKAFLTTAADSSETPEAFAKRLVEHEGVDGVGGFSLIFGRLVAPKEGMRPPLGIVSNRTPDVDGVIWFGEEAGKTTAHTCGLSNSHFGDRAWPKVVDGELLLAHSISLSAKKKESVEQLMDRCFDVLSTDTLSSMMQGQDRESVMKNLRNSIFIPPIGGEGAPGTYGTQKQTVIVVDLEGKVTFVEKSLYGKDAKPTPKEEQVKKYEFMIEGWSS